MKTYMILFALICFGYPRIISAQETPLSGTTPSEVKEEKERVIMYKGNVWHRKDGVSLLLSAEVMIGGTRVNADGTVTFHDGRTTKMKEGDFVESDGTLFRSRSEDSLP